MTKYQCKNCNYKGNSLVFQINSYNYCVATNAEEPEYISDTPNWVKNMGYGEAYVGEPVGCPKCHAWGIDNFEIR
ncbi:MAG: hypothetical protein AB1414_10680 [bacterium]